MDCSVSEKKRDNNEDVESKFIDEMLSIYLRLTPWSLSYDIGCHQDADSGEDDCSKIGHCLRHEHNNACIDQSSNHVCQWVEHSNIALGVELQSIEEG